MTSKLEILNEIITTHQHKKVKCKNGKVLIDVITAQAIMLIYNAIKLEENKAKFLTWDWVAMSNFAWNKCKFSMT